MKRAILLSLLAALPCAAFAQDKGKKPEAPDVNFQFRIDQAIKKGIEHLKGVASCAHLDGDHLQINCDELILLTFVHGGLPETDPKFQELFKKMMEAKLERTYKVALMAMTLEEMDRATYQYRINQCAQFLIDNMGAKGTWRYGMPSIFVDEIKTPSFAPRKDVASSGGNGKVKEFEAGEAPIKMAGSKPKVKKIAVKKQRDGQSDHDHSNMQYAALGLRACHDAGMVFEKDLIKLAQSWWRTAQKEDKNAKEERLEIELPQVKGSGGGRGSTSTVSTATVMAAPQGWCYTDDDGHKAYGSMTAGAIGALCIFDYMLGEDWTKDKDVLEGMQWMAQNFSVTGNPGPHEHRNFEENSKHHYYYFLYGMERVGMLFGTEIIGSHRWYREGAEKLLSSQGGGGAWGNTEETCFAILFLRRATRRLVDVATGPTRGK